MTDVFMSYAREDSDFVRRIYDDLLKHDRNAWVDWEDIPLTADWLQEAYAGIEGANALVFIISPASVRSSPCRLELEHALANNKRLIPILRHEVTEPDDMKQMHPSLSAHNWVKCREVDNYETAFKAILSAIDTDLDFVRAHTRYTVRAVEWESKNHEDSLLLHGKELRAAEAWLHQSQITQPNATPLQREYILSSRKAAIQRRRLNLVITAVTTLIIGLGIIAFFQSIIANRNAEEARAAREEALLNEERARSLALAANAQRLLYLDNNTDLALALALESNRFQQAPPLAGSILAQAAYTPGTRRQWSNFTTNRIARVAISPDGTQALAVGDNDDLVLLNLEDGSEIKRWTMTDTARALAFNPANGQQVAFALDDGTLALLDLSNGKKTPLPANDKPMALTYSSSGNRLLVGYEGGRVRVWELTDGSFRDVTAAGEQDALSVAFSPDGVLAVAGFDDGMIALWNVRSGEIIRSDFTGHDDRVRGLTFRPNGQEFMSASEDSKLILWSVRSSAPVRVFSGHTNGVLSVAISPNGNTAYSGSLDGNIFQWTIDTGERDRAFAGHTSTVYGVALRPDGTQLLSGSTDGTLRLWDLENGAQVRRFGDYTGKVYAAVFTPDGQSVLTASADHQVLLWDVATNTESAHYSNYVNPAQSLAVSPDGMQALVGYEDGSLILLDITTRPALREIRRFNGHSDSVSGITFSPDGRTALSSSYDDTVLVWDVESGRVIRRMTAHVSNVNTVVISPDGHTAISVSTRNDRVIVWDTLTGAIIRSLVGHSAPVYDAAFSPDGTMALTGSQDKTLILWDLATGSVLRQFNGHTDDVYSVTFSPDGTTALSSSLDNTIRLWDIASGEEVLRYNGHTDAVWDANFSPGGNLIVSASADHTARVWQVTTLNELIGWSYTNRYIIDLNCQERSLYRVSEMCASDGSAPPLLAYQRNDTTPPEPTDLPAQSSTQAAQVSPTPTLSAIPVAQIGANVGKLEGDRVDFWTYNGTAGERLSVALEAAHPANAIDDWQEQLKQGLMDTNLLIYKPDGTLLDQNDDVADGQTNSALTDLVLERDGEYRIQITSLYGAPGDYTLTISSAPPAEATPEATPTGGS